MSKKIQNIISIILVLIFIGLLFIPVTVINTDESKVEYSNIYTFIYYENFQ